MKKSCTAELWDLMAGSQMSVDSLGFFLGIL